jgi:protein-disulfide isomerase
MKNGGHDLACLAAKAGYCVFKIKGNDPFFEYKNKVFAHQPELTQERIRAYALEKGLSDAELDACLNDPATHQAIVDQVAQGTAAGVEGTPSIFVNGRMVDSGPNPLILKTIIDRELAGK